MSRSQPKDHSLDKALDEIKKTIASIKPSQSRILAAAELCMKHQRYYKHVVHLFERQFKRIRQSQRLACLYIIDALLKHKNHGSRNPYISRISEKLSTVIYPLIFVTGDDVERLKKVILRWRERDVFSPREFEEIDFFIEEGEKRNWSLEEDTTNPELRESHEQEDTGKQPMLIPSEPVFVPVPPEEQHDASSAPSPHSAQPGMEHYHHEQQQQQLYPNDPNQGMQGYHPSDTHGQPPYGASADIDGSDPQKRHLHGHGGFEPPNMKRMRDMSYSDSNTYQHAYPNDQYVMLHQQNQQPPEGGFPGNEHGYNYPTTTMTGHPGDGMHGSGSIHHQSQHRTDYGPESQGNPSAIPNITPEEILSQPPVTFPVYDDSMSNTTQNPGYIIPKNQYRAYAILQNAFAMESLISGEAIPLTAPTAGDNIDDDPIRLLGSTSNALFPQDYVNEIQIDARNAVVALSTTLWIGTGTHAIPEHVIKEICDYHSKSSVIHINAQKGCAFVRFSSRHAAAMVIRFLGNALLDSIYGDIYIKGMPWFTSQYGSTLPATVTQQSPRQYIDGDIQRFVQLKINYAVGGINKLTFNDVRGHGIVFVNNHQGFNTIPSVPVEDVHDKDIDTVSTHPKAAPTAPMPQSGGGQAGGGGSGASGRPHQYRGPAQPPLGVPTSMQNAYGAAIPQTGSYPFAATQPTPSHAPYNHAQSGAPLEDHTQYAAQPPGFQQYHAHPPPHVGASSISPPPVDTATPPVNTVPFQTPNYHHPGRAPPG